MGVTHLTAVVRNPAEPDRTWEGLFLVDTGATDCLVPRQCLESIGLEPKGQRIYELADGSEIRMDVTVGQIEFMGDFAGDHYCIRRPGRRTAAWGYGARVGGHRSGPAQPESQETACGKAKSGWVWTGVR